MLKSQELEGLETKSRHDFVSVSGPRDGHVFELQAINHAGLNLQGIDGLSLGLRALVLDCEVILAALALVTPVETLLHPYQHKTLNGSVVVSLNGFLNPIRVRHVAPTWSASLETLSTAHRKSTGVAWNPDTAFAFLLQI